MIRNWYDLESGMQTKRELGKMICYYYVNLSFKHIYKIIRIHKHDFVLSITGP